MNTTVLQGQTGAVSVVLVAQGNENALGFTLCFDPNALAYVSASPGSGVSGATLIVNATKAASGQMGFALALGMDITFPGGTTTVVTVTFAASTTASRGYSLTLTDQVVVREISDAGASPLTAEFNGGSISIPAPALAILPSAQNPSVLAGLGGPVHFAGSNRQLGTRHSVVERVNHANRRRQRHIRHAAFKPHQYILSPHRALNPLRRR